MDVLGDLVDRNRRSGTPALRVPAVGREYDYRRFCTSAWKVGNFLRHLGVRSGANVAVADDPTPEPVLTFYGAALLGGVVRFDPPSAPSDDARAVVVPASELDADEVGPGTKAVVYGDRHADPDVAYFERDVWSENPTAPPDLVTPDDLLLRSAERTYTHGEVIAAAETVVEEHAIDADDEVAVAAGTSFSDPGTVAAGLVAPILAGAAVAIGPGAAGDLVVGGSDADVDAATVLSET
jgi:hypothetical protein